MTTRERCEKRLAGLKAMRGPYETEWREIASYAQPARSRWLNSDANKNLRQRNRLNTSHGIFAFRTLQGGMTSGLSSPSRPWFSQTTFNEDLKEEGEVKAWLAEVERRMYAFLAQTNFYGAVKTGYLELGLFGTEACVMVEHPSEGAVCHQLTAGEFWIGIGTSLQADTLYRRAPMTVKQACERFPKDKLRSEVKRDYDQGHYERLVNIFHAIEPNDDHDPERMDAKGKAFRSIYWDEGDHTKAREGDGAVLEVSGFEEKPFWAPRWDTTSSADSWGSGPGHDALPDLRELQVQSKRKGEATDLLIWPEMVAPAKLKLRRQPRSVISAATPDIDKVTVPYEVPYQAVAVIRDDIEKCEGAVDRAAYADLFMAITNMQGIQPRNIEEIASRNEEKLTQLGPVIERVNNEKLEVAIDRTFGIMERAGLLPPAPDIIREEGGQTKTEFVSILTQMQRMVGLGQIERTIGFVGNLAGVVPDVLDKIDYDEVVDEYASRAGAPPKILRSVKDVGKIRQDRANQQSVEQAAAMAGPAKDGAEAARLLAETSQNVMPLAASPIPL